MNSQRIFSSDPSGGMCFKSYPMLINCGQSIQSFANKNVLSPYQDEGSAQRNYFTPHWSTEAVNEALEKDNAFRASFRMNAYHRLDAYCAIDGVKTDALISGLASHTTHYIHENQHPSCLSYPTHHHPFLSPHPTTHPTYPISYLPCPLTCSPSLILSTFRYLLTHFVFHIPITTFLSLHHTTYPLYSPYSLMHFHYSYTP